MRERPDYFMSDHAARRARERKIQESWIAAAMSHPDHREPDRLDPSVEHALKRIPEHGGRVLRVMYNATTIPRRIVSVHFDRRMKGRL